MSAGDCAFVIITKSSIKPINNPLFCKDRIGKMKVTTGADRTKKEAAHTVKYGLKYLYYKTVI